MSSSRCWPYEGELELRVSPPEQTTTLETAGRGSRSPPAPGWLGRGDHAGARSRTPRSCTWLRWRARSLPAPWPAGQGVRGLTPQGLVRRWAGPGIRGRAGPATPEQEALGGAAIAMVLSAEERDSCAGLIATGLGAGAVVAVTAGAAGGQLLLPDGRELPIGGPRVSDPSDDLGAGDVFAAALFVELHGRPARPGGGIRGRRGSGETRREGARRDR